MTIERYHALSGSYLTGELDPEQVREFEELLVRDSDCRAAFECDQQVRRSLQRLRSRSAPASLSNRLVRELDQLETDTTALPSPVEAVVPVAQPVSMNGPSRWRAVAAAAAVCLIVGGWLVLRQQSWTPSRDMAHTHQYYIDQDSAPYEITSSDPRVVSDWVTEQVGYRVRLAERDWELLGARVSSVNRRRAALIFYEDRGTAISLFVLPADTLETDDMRQLQLQGRRIWSQYHQGHKVRIWRDGRLYYASVGSSSGFAWQPGP